MSLATFGMDAELRAKAASKAGEYAAIGWAVANVRGITVLYGYIIVDYFEVFATTHVTVEFCGFCLFALCLAHTHTHTHTYMRISSHGQVFQLFHFYLPLYIMRSFSG